MTRPATPGDGAPGRAAGFRFPDFPKDLDLARSEEETLEFWRRERIFERSVEGRAGSPRFVFYEGPPTANGLPGVHHVSARTVKDLVCRYQTMRGFRVDRKGGWDTHGLPVEIEVEKSLGIEGKDQIEKFGIEAFNAKCRESVFRYEKEWRRITERIGYFVDLDHAYITCSNEYIESVWWIFSRFHEAGLIYKGFKILPYCPRCETPLSSHEVAQGYKDVSDPSVFVRFPLADEPGVSLLVWTTTPWTLPSNTGVAVHPDAEYVRARVGDEVLIVARPRLGVLGEGAAVLGTTRGSDLSGKRYRPPFAFFPDDERTFRAWAADFVSMEEGTGIVHMAPAFGEDDYGLAQREGLPVWKPVDDRGLFTEPVGPWKGRFVKEADPDITRDLAARGLLFRSGSAVHSYPFCWRCDTPLLYLARDSWYIRTTAYRDRMVEENRRIEWFPPETGANRFGDWLENNVDWAISRDRYWGTPLPLWICEGCEARKCVSGRDELRALGARVPADLDLHRPYVDRITFPCAACGGVMRRIESVIDVWFDSGSMPFAQWHYPFENEAAFREQFPADFIAEGIDQSRGWFYSLLAVSTFLEGRSSFRRVMSLDLVLDENGQKMSKSRGNAVEPWKLLDRDGADALRWYLLTTSPPWVPTRFSEAGVIEGKKKLLGTLRNTASFFTTYANLDGARPRRGPRRADLPRLDRWILLELDRLVREATDHMEKYFVTSAGRLIQEFVLEDLSNWYIRRSRRRFWKGEAGPDKDAAYATLFEVLDTLARLLAPFTPFLAEEIHRKVVRAADPSAAESVHLEAWPAAAPAASETAEDRKLLSRMPVAREIVETARAARTKANLKTRQPLAELVVSGDWTHAREAVEEFGDVIREEINVKKISFTKPEGILRVAAKANFRALGARMGGRMKEAAQAIAALPGEAVGRLAAGETIEVVLPDGVFPISPGEVEIHRSAPEGMAAEGAGEKVLALDTRLSPELREEGLVRELVHRLQTLRKEKSFEVTDRVRITVRASEGLRAALDRHRTWVAGEVLAAELSQAPPGSPLGTAWSLDGESIELSMEPASRP